MHAQFRSTRLHRLVRLIPTRSAWAHSTSECYVYFRPSGTSLEGSLQMPIGMVAKAIGADIGPDSTPDDLEAERDAIVSLVSRAFTLRENGADMYLELGKIRTVDTGAGRFCALSYSAPAAPLPRSVTLSIDGLLEIDHHVAAVAVVRTDEGWGKFGRRVREQLQLDHHHPSRVITLTEPSFFDHLTATVRGIVRRSKSRVSAAARS